MIMCCVVKETMFGDGVAYFVHNHSTLIGGVNPIMSMFNKKKTPPKEKKTLLESVSSGGII